METWLTAWPIAFPIVYLVGPQVVKLAARISALSARTAAFEPVGLALRATAKKNLKARRKLKSSHA